MFLLCLVGKLHPLIIKSCLGVIMPSILALFLSTARSGVGARHDLAQKHFLDNRVASADNEWTLMWSDSHAGMQNQEVFLHPP